MFSVDPTLHAICQIGVRSAVALAMALTLNGCANKKESEKSRSEVERAASLIDQAQYSEAIYILNNKLKTDTRDQRARLLLASAYSARGGLKFLDFRRFASQVSSWSSQDEPTLFTARNRVLQSVVRIIWQVQRFSQAFETVPAPPDVRGYEDLRSALMVLDEAGELTGGASLYRALLRVVIFKHDVNERYGIVPINGCGIDLPQLMRWFTEVGAELERMMTDYAFSLKDPKAREKTLRSVAGIRKTALDGRNMLGGVKGGETLSYIQQSLAQGQSCAP